MPPIFPQSVQFPSLPAIYRPSRAIIFLGRRSLLCPSGSPAFLPAKNLSALGGVTCRKLFLMILGPFVCSSESTIITFNCSDYNRGDNVMIDEQWLHLEKGCRTEASRLCVTMFSPGSSPPSQSRLRRNSSDSITKKKRIEEFRLPQGTV